MISRAILLLMVPLFAWCGEFKVASYNVENLFDDRRDGSEYRDYIPDKHNWTSRMVEIKLNNISEVLCELDAGIVALQEIENRHILTRLQKRLKRVGCPYRYSAITSKKKASAISVALLSRYPITKQRELQVSYSPRDRNILEAQVTIEGEEIIIFVNHWKSKANNGKESRRVRYAKVLARRVAALPKEKEYIIIGDLNSEYDEYRVFKNKFNDTRGITAINHILKTVDQQKMIEKDDISKRDSEGYYNLWLEYPHSQRWSHNYYGHKGALDHILLPHALFDGRGIDYVNNSFGHFRPKFLFTKQGWIYRWGYKNGKHLGEGYSDHLPIYAYFSTKPFVAERSRKPIASNIERLYSVERLAQPVMLTGCSLILKRGDSGIIKQTATGKAIYLYGTARALVEGKRYDLIVNQIKSYKGLKEITDISQATEIESVNIESYYLTQSELNLGDKKRENQVFRHIRGVYKDGFLSVGERKIPIYFKKKRTIPPKETKLTIHYAHLGYYNSVQLVIYDQADFFEER